MANLTRRETEREAIQAGNGEEITPQAERFVTPRVSVYETPEEVRLELEMPGVSRDSIDISLERDELTVTGTRKREDFRGEVLHRERLTNSFRRSFVLSERIDGNAIRARYENGILFLTLPKSEDQKPKKITIE